MAQLSLAFWNLQRSNTKTAEKASLVKQFIEGGYADIYCFCEVGPDMEELFMRWSEGTRSGRNRHISTYGFVEILDKNGDASGLNLAIVAGLGDAVPDFTNVDTAGRIIMEDVGLTAYNTLGKQINLKRDLLRVRTSAGDIYVIHAPANKHPATHVRSAIINALADEVAASQNGYKAVVIGDMNVDYGLVNKQAHTKSNRVVNIFTVPPKMSETHRQGHTLDYLIQCDWAATASPLVENFKAAGSMGVHIDHLPVRYLLDL
jgi:hypothetical protein